MVQVKNYLHNEFLEWGDGIDKMIKSDRFIKRSGIPQSIVSIDFSFIGKSMNETVDKVEFIDDVHLWCRDNNITCKAINMRTQFTNDINGNHYWSNSWVGILFDNNEDAVAFKLRWI